MTDSWGITHHGKAHRIIWRVLKYHSVFGLKNIHAILECNVCGVVRKPEVIPLDKFKITGTKRKSYWIETDEKTLTSTP